MDSEMEAGVIGVMSYVTLMEASLPVDRLR